MLLLVLCTGKTFCELWSFEMMVEMTCQNYRVYYTRSVSPSAYPGGRGLLSAIVDFCHHVQSNTSRVHREIKYKFSSIVRLVVAR